LPFFVPQIDPIRAASRTLVGVAGVGFQGAGPIVAVENGSASYINVVPVTGDFFGVVGVEPILGRALNRKDDVTGTEYALVISHGLWKRRYGGSDDVIGRRLIVGEWPFTIVGVMPSGFEYPRGVEMWMTVAALTSTFTNPAFRVDVDLIARMHPGATIQQATSELQRLSSQLEAETNPPGSPSPIGMTPVVRTYEDVVVGDVRTAMFILFGAVGLVLLIASANVANLLLLRGQTRRAELAVRAALGAGRARLARQALVESLVLALAAGLVGLVATSWTLRALMALVPNGLPRVDSVHIDAGVILFTIVVAFLAAALAGLAPAIASTRVDLISQLRSSGRGLTGSARHGRRALVVMQIALAVTVVAAAGLLVRSLVRLQSVEMGLAADRLVLVSLSLPQAKYGDRERHLQFLSTVVATLEASPDIAAATPVSVAPFSGTDGWELPRFTAEGQSADRAATNPSLNLEAIHPNYFKTFEVTLVRGRAFTEADRQGAPDVAIVSEDVARRTWPAQDPIGKRIKFGSADSPDGWRTVVGVARPTRYRELLEPRSTLYLPSEQFIVAARMLVLRTSSPLAVVARAVRERVGAVDRDVQVMRVAPFSELLERPLARPRFNAFLIVVFGLAALLLAAVGVYALIAASVRQRYAEIGLRMALGATASNVRALVLSEGLRLAGIGAAIGLATAMAVTHLLRGLLFGVDALDAVSMVTAVLLLVGVSTLASYVPARRATRVDPMFALRTE
jgi:predicted permease